MKIIFYISIIFFFTLTSCKSIQQPIYLATENVRLNNLGFKQSLLKAEMKFYNPNRKSIKFKSAYINVFLQERLLGNISFDTFVNMQPKDTLFVPVSGTISIKSALANAANILLKDSVKVKMHGNVKAGTNGIYKNIVVNYEGKYAKNKFFNDTIR